MTNDKRERVPRPAGRTENVLDALPDIMFLVDEKGVYRDVFAAGKEQMLYVPREAIVGRRATDIFDAETGRTFLEATGEVIRSGQAKQIEYPMQVGGKKEFYEARIVPTECRCDGLRCVLVIVREVTKRHADDSMARLIEKVFEEATEGIIIEDEDRTVIRVNPAMLRIIGMTEEELIGMRSESLSQRIPEEQANAIREGMESRGYWHGEITFTRGDGQERLGWLSMDAVADGGNRVSHFLIMLTDISEVRRSREQLEYMATHDRLTGLPNRVLLFDRLEHIIAKMERSGGMGALLFLDIDHFKDVNDNFGHQVGDKLLKEVGQRLSDAVRASDTVGRLGGDEFLIILEDLESIDEILVVIQKIRDLFALPVAIDGYEVDARFSIGIALVPDDGGDAEHLINAADRAMYVVKERGRDGFEFYSRDYSKLSHEYFRIQRAIRQAIRDEAFYMVYQPQFSLADGRLTGAEALLRCSIPEMEDVPVAKIISVAEESGAIHEIGKIVLRNVCEQIAQWRMLSLTPIRIAVNLSRRELGSETLVETILTQITRCGIEAGELEFEITESTLMQSGASAHENIGALREMGCRFSIDDFGTGYSSLSNLKEFDLDKLKIDRSFVEKLTTDRNDQIIVSATVSMAKKLGLTVLAEGVETAEQAELLRTFECEEVQGFFYSRPVKSEAMTELLKAING